MSNTVASAVPPNAASVGAEPQPHLLPSEIASTTSAIDAVASAVPMTSSGAVLLLGALWGRCRRPAHHTTPVSTAGPAIAHCQPPFSMMSAPSVGPDAPPIVVMA